jgi:hypothetical protein
MNTWEGGNMKYFGYVTELLITGLVWMDYGLFLSFVIFLIFVNLEVVRWMTLEHTKFIRHLIDRR